jgi:hypothetical protein
MDIENRKRYIITAVWFVYCIADVWSKLAWSVLGLRPPLLDANILRPPVIMEVLEWQNIKPTQHHASASSPLRP